MPKTKKIWENPLFLWIVYALFTFMKFIWTVMASAYHKVKPNRFWDRKFRKWEW